MANELQALIDQNGLEGTKAQTLLDNFQNYFELASKWELKAKSICVTNEDQTAEMEMARTGRLFLREKRISIEKTRVDLKQQSLREGKAIDGIANVLKALIVPIEEYLGEQEKFIENQNKKKEDEIRAKIEKEIEEERLAKEKAEKDEQERIRKENEELKKQAEEREAKMKAEREEQERKLREEQEKSRKEREEMEKIAEDKRKEADAKLAEEKAKADAERKKIEAEAQKQREDAEQKQRDADVKAKAEKDRIRKEAEEKAEIARNEKEALEEQLRNTIECPKCKHKFILNKEKK